jgi:hypothetical protein
MLLEEHLAPQLALQISDAQLLASRQSAYQRIDVYDSPTFGRLFRLDDVLMSTEADEFYYHETLVHPALLSQNQPQRVLILGGGDGGSARQALKHGSVQRIDVVELDAEVVALARQYLPGVYGGALDDPRVALHIGDGKDFVSACRETYEHLIQFLHLGGQIVGQERLEHVDFVFEAEKGAMLAEAVYLLAIPRQILLRGHELVDSIPNLSTTDKNFLNGVLGGAINSVTPEDYIQHQWQSVGRYTKSYIEDRVARERGLQNDNCEDFLGSIVRIWKDLF